MKQVLKEQIKFGNCDPKLFQESRIIEGINDPAVLELLSKRAYLIELRKGKKIPFLNDKYYKLLFGEYEIEDNLLIAIQNCDIIILEKSLVEYFQKEQIERDYEEYISVFDSIGTFTRLDHEQMKSLIKRSNILRVNENRILYSEGQVPTDCTVVIKGCLELYKNIQGIQIKVDQNRKLIGLNECLNALKLQYNVRTTKQTQIIVINRETLLQFEPFLKKERTKNYFIEQDDIKREVEWRKIKKSKQLCDLGIIDEVYTEINNKRKQQRIRTNSYY